MSAGRHLRVGVVAPEFPPDVGGVETYALEFSRELARRGHEVTVFTGRHSQGEIDEPGLSVQPVLTMRRNLDLQILGKANVDVWHAMNAAYAWLAEEGRPTIVSVHGNDFLKPYVTVGKLDPRRMPVLWRLATMEAGWLEPFWAWRTERVVRRALPKVAHIIANSRYTEQALLDTYPACRGRTSVAYVGVAERFFSVEHRAPADGIPRLLTVSRLSEARKNVDLVISALARLRDRHAFTYTIVGDGHDRPRLERLSQELGVAGRVRFTGRVGQQELTQAYAAADLFVLASSVLPGSHEGFGIVYLEAAASGVPSLAARLAGAAEAVEQGGSGMFVEQPTVESLETALAEFLSGRVRFDPGACRRFAERFLWKRVVDHALAFYPGAAAERRAA